MSRNRSFLRPLISSLFCHFATPHFRCFVTSFSLCLVVILAGCRKNESDNFIDLPVVEAYLSPGHPITVRVSQKVPYDENTTAPSRDLDALGVTIGYAGQEYPLAVMGNGIYRDTAGRIPVMTDSTYTLRLTYNNTRVSSSTCIPSKPKSVSQSVTSITLSQIDPDDPPAPGQFTPVTISFANADESNYLATIECIDTTLVPVYKDSIPDIDMFSSHPVTGTEIEIRPQSIRYFGLNRIILYHINPEYRVFFLRQQNTSQSYQDPPTNVANGLGIFTGVNADTLYLNVIQSK